MLVFLYTYPNITCSASCSGQHTDDKQVLCSHDIFFLLKSVATASDQGKGILGCPKLFSTWYRLVMPRLCRGGGDVEYESPLVIQILAALWCFTTPFKQTDSIPATAFYYSLRSGSVYPCAVAAALVEKTKHRGGTGKRPVPAMPHLATTGVAQSFFFFPHSFRGQDISPAGPVQKPIAYSLLLSLSSSFSSLPSHLSPHSLLFHFPDTP